MSMRASAARYARALLDITINESDPVAAETDLAGFVDLVQQHPDLQRTLANPVVSAAARSARSCSRSSSAVSRRRLSESSSCCWLREGVSSSLPDVLAVYRERLMEHRQIIQAEVTTADAALARARLGIAAAPRENHRAHCDHDDEG